jgi:hypothetical protein
MKMTLYDQGAIVIVEVPELDLPLHILAEMGLVRVAKESEK